MEANSIGGYYGPYNSAGSASARFRYTLIILQETTFTEISCDSLPSAVPTPHANTGALPADAAERVESAMATTDAGAIAAELRMLSPVAGLTIETTITDGGELVVAVGPPSANDCVLRVRTESGEITAPPYDPIWLEPGEAGCSTRLYTAPPL